MPTFGRFGTKERSSATLLMARRPRTMRCARGLAEFALRSADDGDDGALRADRERRGIGVQYDLVVIGSGPAGQKAAVNAAKLGRSVVLIERVGCVGGVCVNTGTIPSKAMREAVLHLTGRRQRFFYGSGYSVKGQITIADLHQRTQHVIRSEIDTIQAQMGRNGIRVIRGEASFVEPHVVRVTGCEPTQDLLARHVLIAVGTRPARPANVPFTGQRVIDSDQVLELDHLPRSMVIVGAGVIGLEYACMFAALGVQTCIVDKGTRILPFVDAEVAESLQYQMRDMNVRFRLGEEIAHVALGEDDVVVTLKSHTKLRAETVLFAAGRQGNIEPLNLPAAGLQADERGRISVNEFYQTEAPHIYAAGDVIGFPSLAATSMEQGRLASSYMFGRAWEQTQPLFPYGIYTIPEISMIGPTEAELSKQGVPYEVGLARYREIARGKLIGDVGGLLKLMFHTESRRILAVHILGEGATELIHIGQTAMAAGFPIDYFVSTVFNYPTLAECYRVAALDGINRVRTRDGTVDTDEAAGAIPTAGGADCPDASSSLPDPQPTCA